jgi:hypothetical protein
MEKGEKKIKWLKTIVNDFANSILFNFRVDPSKNALVTIGYYWCKYPFNAAPGSYAKSTPSRTESLKIIIKELLKAQVNLSIEIINVKIISINLFSSNDCFAIPHNVLIPEEREMLEIIIRNMEQVFEKVDHDTTRNTLSMRQTKPFFRCDLDSKLIIKSFCYNILMEGVLFRKFLDSKDILLNSLQDLKENGGLSRSKQDILDEISAMISTDPLLVSVCHYMRDFASFHIQEH